MTTLSVAWVKAKVKQRELPALFVLGLMYQSGYQSIEPNIVKAKDCYYQAATLGFVPAQLRFDELCTMGAGLPQK